MAVQPNGYAVLLFPIKDRQGKALLDRQASARLPFTWNRPLLGLLVLGEASMRFSAGEKRSGSGGAPRAPVAPSPKPPGLASVLARNIDALTKRRLREERQATVQEKIADAITRFTGSMPFVYLHLLIFGFWIVANLGWVPGVPIWDASFVILAMWASVEAIFLSTFVLISQNRMAAAADKRADLDLQISLLAEHEVTKLMAVITAIAERVGVRVSEDPELEEAKQDVVPEAVLDEIENKTG